VSVTLAAVLAIVLALQLARSASELRIAVLLLGMPLGFLTADIASGLMHWFCDTYFHPRTPLIGPMIIAPFREHHVDPAALARHGFLERNGNNCLACLPLFVVTFELLASARPVAVWHDGLIGYLAALTVTLCLTNQIHAWAHSECVPGIVRRLQRAGVLIAPERHFVHHRACDGRAYAVVCGWSNRWLDFACAHAELVLERFGLRRDGAA